MVEFDLSLFENIYLSNEEHIPRTRFMVNNLKGVNIRLKYTYLVPGDIIETLSGHIGRLLGLLHKDGSSFIAYTKCDVVYNDDGGSIIPQTVIMITSNYHRNLYIDPINQFKQLVKLYPLSTEKCIVVV